MSDKQFLQNDFSERPPPYTDASQSAPTPGYAQNDQKMYPPVKPAPGFQPMPPQGYPGAGPANVNAMAAQNVVIVGAGIRYGPFPMRVTCQSCHQDINTVTKPVVGGITWLLAGILAMSGLFCGCCLLPFCVDACQDIEHHCPNCGTYLGIYKRMG
ncbi:hypothetical protein B4U79_04719 [Dinothrombium tinctorium]|uniref:LITAF domain-containing protein n=1 Tax=Dinothrombium tinctorium TaxID=1965070 RepID=A0A443R2B1_9ACAR|nr:hypothetical protein B4U79_04719 [Dinothrombium tinctorium]